MLYKRYESTCGRLTIEIHKRRLGYYVIHRELVDKTTNEYEQTRSSKPIQCIIRASKVAENDVREAENIDGYRFKSPYMVQLPQSKKLRAERETGGTGEYKFSYSAPFRR